MRARLPIILTFCGYVVGIGAQDQVSVQTLLDRLREPRLDLSVVSSLARYRDERVLPSLKQAFETHPSKEDRQYIATSIVRLGEKDDMYYRYLESYAKEAIESDIPDPFAYNPDGSDARGKVNPELKAWAEKHRISPEAAFHQATNTYPTDVLVFGGVRDPRMIQLLRRGFNSANSLVVAASAHVLAEMNDVDSIPLILRTANANKPVAMVIVGYLSMYNLDADAENRISDSLRDPKLKELYRWATETKRKQAVESKQADH